MQPGRAEAPSDAAVPPMAARVHPRGFVLVHVLIIVAIVAAAAVLLIERSRTANLSIAVAVETAQARAAADAGVARLVRALRVPGDPLLARLLAGTGPVPWRFAGFRIALSIERESGKVDLNAGDFALAGAFLDRLVADEALRERLRARLVELRHDETPIASVASLLMPCERLTPAAETLDAAFTVLTGNRGLAPRATDPERLRLVPSITDAEIAAMAALAGAGRSPLDDDRFSALSPYLSDEDPIYRLRATAAGGVSLSREAVVLLEPLPPFLRLLSVQDVVAPAAIPCAVAGRKR